jgi:four helix bundle protein
MNMNDFRFQQLTIWKDSVEIMNPLYEFAERVSQQKYFRFAEQLRAAGLSISNNIAEGSGSSSNKEFANFLNIARRSVYECANMMFVFEKFGFISSLEREVINSRLQKLAAQIISFKNSLK